MILVSDAGEALRNPALRENRNLAGIRIQHIGRITRIGRCRTRQ